MSLFLFSQGFILSLFMNLSFQGVWAIREREGRRGWIEKGGRKPVFTGKFRYQALCLIYSSPQMARVGITFPDKQKDLNFLSEFMQ